jgi:hypothetical protein
MQRTTVMAGRQIGRPCHSQGGRHQHRFDRHAGAQLLQRAVDDFGAWGFLDELDQRFYRLWVLDT